MNKAMLMREKVGKLVMLLTERKVRVTQRGARAYVEYDPRTDVPRLVNVPYIPDDASSDYLDAIEGFLDHEVAHVLFTSPAVLKAAKKQGVGQLHNVIEDVFIEKKMAETFRGSASNLSNVGKFFLDNYTEKQLAENPSLAIGLLMVPAIRALAGQAVFSDYMKHKWPQVEAALGKAMPYLREHLPKMKSSEDALAIATTVKRLIDAPDEPTDDGDDGEGGSPTTSGGKSKPSAGSTKKGDQLDDSGEPEGEGEGGEGSGESESEGGGAGGEGESEATSAKGGHAAGDGDAPPMPTTGFQESDDDTPPVSEDDDGKAPLSWKEFEDMLGKGDFDEKISEVLSERGAAESRDADYLIYTTEKDRVEPLETSSSSDAGLKAMQDKVDHMIGTLQKDLERAVAARSRSVLTSGHRSGRIHAASLSRLTMFKDERVFRRKQESTTKDVAVTLLVDCSGSMFGEKIQTATYTAYGLSSVLDRMNISNEVIGFTTRGSFGREAEDEEEKLGVRYSRYEPLYLPVIKDFTERLGLENKRRFAVLSQATWLRQNVDGESVQIAAARLSRRREQRKILIVLSDGHPACPGNAAALRSHLAKSVKEVEATGIEVLGIGILDDAPKQFYKKHVVLNCLDDLPTSVMGEIKRLLMKP